MFDVYVAVIKATVWSFLFFYDNIHTPTAD